VPSTVRGAAQRRVKLPLSLFVNPFTPVQACASLIFQLSSITAHDMIRSLRWQETQKTSGTRSELMQ